MYCTKGTLHKPPDANEMGTYSQETDSTEKFDIFSPCVLLKTHNKIILSALSKFETLFFFCPLIKATCCCYEANCTWHGGAFCKSFYQNNLPQHTPS